MTRKETHIFAEHPDPKAMQQFSEAMDQRFAVKGALMPDAHVGYSLPIGGVVATRGVIVPAWVGYDIGCGVLAVPTSFRREEIESAREGIFAEIYRAVPVGDRGHAESRVADWNRNALPHTQDLDRIFERRKGRLQMGTLGSGNHFAEIGFDEEDGIWIVIHSGSRGTGHGVATHYMKKASGTDKPREGHFGFEVDSPDGLAYVADMNYCLQYALDNRKEIARRIVRSIALFCQGGADFSRLINRNHNHAEPKDGLWIHRKGATHAEQGMMGVIPGNMRDGSFIVEGLGNPRSLYSSSHGAGRLLGRKEAERRLDYQTFSALIRNAGVLAKIKGNLDESPDAYKDIFDVLRQQSELCVVHHHIRPIINIKA